MGIQYLYVGELDSEGRACGFGVANRQGLGKYQGSFLNDKAEGL